MNTTSRILGESTASAFDDLIKLSSAIKSREHTSEAIFDVQAVRKKARGNRRTL